MRRLVIDASVYVKWFNRGEEYEGQAISIRDDYVEGRLELQSPSLLLYEALNAVRKNPNLANEEARDLAIEVYELMPAQTELNSDIAKATVDLARERSISVYDACYIELARRLKIQLITADEKQHRAARDYANCKHLKDYRPVVST